MKRNYAGYIVIDNENTISGEMVDGRYFFSKKNWSDSYYVEYLPETRKFLACIVGVDSPECVEENCLLDAVDLVDDWNRL